MYIELVCGWDCLALNLENNWQRLTVQVIVSGLDQDCLTNYGKPGVKSCGKNLILVTSWDLYRLDGNA